MRFYSFTNFYLSSIQQGIQPAHCIADMFVKYANEGPRRSILHDWAANHKTMICLNGGNAADINNLYLTLLDLGCALELPFGKFHEDEQSLNGTMTCCGIIVPEKIYEFAAEYRQQPIGEVGTGGLSQPEFELALLLNQYGLAK